MAKKPHIAKSFSGTEASTIFIKGNIHTMNEKQPTVEAVALYENLIVFAGKEEEALKLKTPQTTVIDLGGRTMFPGFIDPHIHMMFALF
jgi:predicted amidohydrolase YtcJ